MFELRDYQKKAVEKLLWSMTLEGADLCVLPTGAGKSLVIAELSHRINKPILILQPSKEILEQNYNKLLMYVPKDDIGVYSASVNRKDISKYTFATIQSIYKEPEKFNHFDIVLVDEAHMINPKDTNSMYMKFFKGIGTPKVIGLTATPYRLDTTYERVDSCNFIAYTGTKLINRVKGNFWSRIVFNINVGDLIREDYLVGLRYVDKTILEHKDIPANLSLSDFNLKRYVKRISNDTDDILRSIFIAESVSKHVLVFCSTIEQAVELSEMVTGSKVVTSKTKKKDRENMILDFRLGKIKTIFNVGVLTTGFDFPELDCIVLLRPTKSMALYYQMLGRGVRKAEGKKFCRVIDITGTVKHLGRVETIKLQKDRMWELISETGSWHNKPLYKMEISSK